MHTSVSLTGGGSVRLEMLLSIISKQEFEEVEKKKMKEVKETRGGSQRSRKTKLKRPEAVPLCLSLSLRDQWLE